MNATHSVSVVVILVLVGIPATAQNGPIARAIRQESVRLAAQSNPADVQAPDSFSDPAWGGVVHLPISTGIEIQFRDGPPLRSLLVAADAASLTVVKLGEIGAADGLPVRS